MANLENRENSSSPLNHAHHLLDHLKRNKALIAIGLLAITEIIGLPPIEKPNMPELILMSLGLGITAGLAAKKAWQEIIARKS